MYSALMIAEYVIAYYGKTEWIISNFKLQKVLYFLQVEYALRFDKPLFLDNIESWDFGPVVPIVYEKYEKFGTADIPGFLVINTRINQEDKIIIDEVLEKLKSYTNNDLTAMVISQKPWIKNYKKGMRNIISFEDMKKE